MFRYWIVFYLIFVWNTVSAVEVTDLYTAKVDLKSQAKKDQNQALKTAFEAVLIKISGNTEILSNLSIKNEARRYDKYLTQFNYVTTDNEHKLEASFDEVKITQLFFQQNLPLWGRLRPLVLFWVITEDGLSRRVISETDKSPLHHQISSIAEKRGLPIVLPLMDLTDSQNLRTSDLWGRFIEPIKLASKRYNPENIVVIRVSKNMDVELEVPSADCSLLCKQPSIKIDWHLVSSQSDKIYSGNSYQGEDDLVLIKEVMSDITKNIAKKYALTTETDHELIIDVVNIDSLSKYVEVTHFLEKLSAITAVKLIKVRGNNRRFKLSLMGAPESIFASLQLNKKLKQYIDPLVGESVGDIPVFFLGN